MFFTTTSMMTPNRHFAPAAPSLDFAEVKFLAGWNGADADTSFTEESNNTAIGTFVDNAQLDDAEKKFGTTSLILDGTGDWVTFPSIAAYNLTNESFTIETFIRFTTIPASSVHYFISQFANTVAQRAFAFGFLNFGAGIFRFVYNTTVSQTTIDLTWLPVSNTWYHVAAARDADDLRLFVDGVQIGTTHDMAGATIVSSPKVLTVGALGTDASAEQPIRGRIDETRIVIGSALYTENFTPPILEFPRS